MAAHMRMSTEAQEIAMRGYDHVRRLGHRHFGAEHFLLALSSADHPAGEILRGHGATADGVEHELVRLAGQGPGASLLSDLDAAALAAIGVDIAVVRACVEAAFDDRVLAEADTAVHGTSGRPRLGRQAIARSGQRAS
jgi:hypothetical protein